MVHHASLMPAPCATLYARCQSLTLDLEASLGFGCDSHRLLHGYRRAMTVCRGYAYAADMSECALMGGNDPGGLGPWHRTLR